MSFLILTNTYQLVFDAPTRKFQYRIVLVSRLNCVGLRTLRPPGLLGRINYIIAVIVNVIVAHIA